MTFTISSKEFSPKGEIDLSNRNLQTEEGWPGVASSQAEIVAIAEECACKMALVVGRPQDLVSVGITGHAAPNHDSGGVAAEEFLSITVSVRRLE